MALRVTPGMMHNNLVRNINHNLTRLDQEQYMLSTGRKLNKPSDDPAGITYSLRYRSEIAMNNQYEKNISTAQSQLEHTDTVLGQLNDVVQRVQELTTQALNSTNPQSALDAIKQEITQLYDQAVAIGNDQLNGKYIFNGQMTDKQPYDAANADKQDTDTQKFYMQFSAGVEVPINITGNEVFGSSTDSDNLFKVLKDIESSLTAPYNSSQLTAAVTQLQSRYDKIINIRSEVGARTNRVDLIDQRNQDLTQNLTELQSKVEDADIAETIMNFNVNQNVYQAALSTGAKIIQPSLIDYLR
jgi:flagellar hook-associated protein 3 FlgL